MVKKGTMWLGITAFVVLAIALASGSRNRTVLPDPPGKMTYVESPSEEGLLAITFSDLEAAFKKADVVALVKADGEAGSHNMAVDPNEPSRPDPNIEVVGKDERLSIERYFKGVGPDSILVTQPYQFIDHSVNVKSDYATYVPFSTGQRYLVFLRKSIDGSDRYVGAGEPWRFALTGGKAQVVTNIHSLATQFPGTLETDVVTKLQDLGRNLDQQHP